LELDVPTLSLHRINGDSAENYHLMDKESTGGMFIQPGTTSSWMRNPPEEYLICQELPSQGRGIH
jgi:hypothetical protein